MNSLAKTKRPNNAHQTIPTFPRRCVPEIGLVLYFLPAGVREAIHLAVLYGNKN
jgi:hypothetical protein